MPNSSVRAEFVESFGVPFLQQVVVSVEHAYAAARDATCEIDEHLHRNVAGTYRWGHIETRLVATAESLGLDAQWQANSVHSAYHVEVRAGRFVLTVARADEPGKLPPDAEYRTTLMEATQLRLWSRPIPSGGHIVALVTHGPDSGMAAPRFVEVLFPDPDGQIVDRFDLLGLARPLAQGLVEERIADGAVPVLRRARPAAGGEHRGTNQR